MLSVHCKIYLSLIDEYGLPEDSVSCKLASLAFSLIARLLALARLEQAEKEKTRVEQTQVMVTMSWSITVIIFWEKYLIVNN